MDATSYFQYTCFMARRGSYSWRTRLGSVNVAAASVNSESALGAGSYFKAFNVVLAVSCDVRIRDPMVERCIDASTASRC